MFFNQKNEWNQDVKSNFETSEFWVVPIPKFALVRIIVHQLKNLNLKICMVFTQEFEFCFQIFIPLVLRNLIFETSEAPLSSIWKNWQKSLFFHEYLPKGLTNFGCSESKLHTLNYHNDYCKLIGKIRFSWKIFLTWPKSPQTATKHDLIW